MSDSLVSDETLRSLLNDAERIKRKPPPPRALDVALEMYEVIGMLWDKGLTRKQMIAWLGKRGFTFKPYHISKALCHYHESRTVQNNGTEDQQE